MVKRNASGNGFSAIDLVVVVVVVVVIEYWEIAVILLETKSLVTNESDKEYGKKVISISNFWFRDSVEVH